MQIPTTVKLGGVVYTVGLTSAIADYGHTDLETHHIYINSKYGLATQLQTFFHEVGHVIMEVRGRLLREMYDKMTKEEFEEAVVEIIGTGIADIILQGDINVQ